jgi:hypothetical protein
MYWGRGLVIVLSQRKIRKRLYLFLPAPVAYYIILLNNLLNYRHKEDIYGVRV